MTTRLKHLLQTPFTWATILFISLPFLMFPEIIFGGQTLYWSDLTWIHYPRHIFAAQEWLAGRIPLWDPYQHNGLPFLAETQVGTLYLFSALFLSSLTPSLELSLFILLHFTLAAIFTYILARSLDLSPTAATVAGLSFGFGGFLMAQVANLNIMTGAVWLPLILYGAIQSIRHRSWLIAMLTGIPLSFQIFTAQPQVVFYSLVTVCGYGFYQLTVDFFVAPSVSSQKRILSKSKGEASRIDGLDANKLCSDLPRPHATLKFKEDMNKLLVCADQTNSLTYNLGKNWIY